jgi:hypothetical protein
MLSNAMRLCLWEFISNNDGQRRGTPDTQIVAVPLLSIVSGSFEVGHSPPFSFAAL